MELWRPGPLVLSPSCLLLLRRGVNAPLTTTGLELWNRGTFHQLLQPPWPVFTLWLF